MKRLFAAIKITPDENFLRIYYNLKNSCKYDKINWVNPENIHITLKFFGETEENRIEQISSLLREVSTNHPSFKIGLQDIGIFGSHYKPRVIWFGIKKSRELESLASIVHDRMDNIGFIKDRQNFVPHLTIGRIKFIDNKQRFSELIQKNNSIQIQELNITEFYLFESILSSSGPKYHFVDKYDLSC